MDLLSDTILQAEDHQIGCFTCFHYSGQPNDDKINENEFACLNQFDLTMDVEDNLLDCKVIITPCTRNVWLFHNLHLKIHRNN